MNTFSNKRFFKLLLLVSIFFLLVLSNAVVFGARTSSGNASIRQKTTARNARSTSSIQRQQELANIQTRTRQFLQEQRDMAASRQRRLKRVPNKNRVEEKPEIEEILQRFGI
jgi:ABC-type transport system involved in cytochrome bd biosynthesis fused ATPase/permease subunit